MELFLNLLNVVLQQGLVYGIVALGAYISYTVLDFPDLSVDGTFPLGAAVTAALITAGWNPWLTLLVSLLAGAAAGAITGLLHVRFRISNLLSGILVMTALYSVNLRIAGNRALLPIIGMKTIFEGARDIRMLLLLAALVVLCKLLLDAYLKTKSGMLLRAVGDNVQLITSVAEDSGRYKIIGLAVGNGLVATAGSVLCQQTQVFDLTMGTGMVVMGLASVIIGISLFGKLSWLKATTAVVLGSILYRACVQIALQIPGFSAGDLKLIMAVIFTATLIVHQRMKGRKGMAA